MSCKSKKPSRPVPTPFDVSMVQNLSVVQKQGVTAKGGKFSLTVAMSSVTINGQEVSSDVAAEATAAFIEAALNGDLHNQ